MKDYYKILGVEKNASEASIREQYRKLARKYHPDVYKGSDAEEIFKDINEAYAILSDSLKRADYDQELEERFMRRKEERQTEEPRETSENAEPTLGMFLAAFGRTAFVGLIVALACGLLEIIIWFLGKQKILSLDQIYSSMAVGGIIGLLLGGDMNFNVESFLGRGYMGRTYTFLRTFIYALSFAFIGARLFSLFPVYFKGTEWLQIAGLALGIILGATFGSDNEGLLKLRSKEGRFNLFYIAIRAIEVGFLGFLISSVLGITIQLVYPNLILFWPTIFASFLGIIFGAVSPSNLASYASYASGAVKNIIVILMVGGALVLGIIFGVIFNPQIQDFIKIFVK